MSSLLLLLLLSPAVLFAQNSSIPVNSVECQCKGRCKTTSDCYCPTGTYSMSDDKNNLPEDGCYYNPGSKLNNALAQRQCSALGGFLVQDDARYKDDWLFTTQGVWPNGGWELIWIGLIFDRISQQYYWPDNTAVGHFAPWNPSVKFPPPAGQDCVIDTLDGWYPADCRTAYSFICELPPCDSRGFCTPLS